MAKADSNNRNRNFQRSYSEDEGCFCPRRLKSIFTTEDLKRARIFQELAAEFLGSALLVIFGCGSAVTLEPNLAPTVPSIAIAFGLTVATIIWTLGHCVGAIAGAYILYGLTPPERRGMLGITLVSDKITLWQGVGVEILATFMLVLAIYATIDNGITDHPGSKALSIGFVVTMDIPWAIQYTGASMNPARSLGPVVAMGVWDHHWVFWVGPIIGAVGAGLLYESLFATNASSKKLRRCLCNPVYGDVEIATETSEMVVVTENKTVTSGFCDVDYKAHVHAQL